MSTENPYQAPSAEVTIEPAIVRGEFDLAGRGQRLIAAIVDSLINMACTLPLMFLLGIVLYGMPSDAVLLLDNGPLSFSLVTLVMGFTVYLLVHGYLLYQYGQSVGKRLLDIQIVNLSNNVPSFRRLILLRELPVWIVSILPVLGSILPLIDVLFIFRDDRRCVHDLIAGTQVIRGSSQRREGQAAGDQEGGNRVR